MFVRILVVRRCGKCYSVVDLLIERFDGLVGVIRRAQFYIIVSELVRGNVTASILTVNLSVRSTTIIIIAIHMATMLLTAIQALLVLIQTLDIRRTRRALTLLETVLGELLYAYDT